MAICNSTCAPDLPVNYTAGCGIKSRPGGIKRFWFFKCDFDFTVPTDRDEWEAGVLAGNIVSSGLILGQKAKGSFTKKRIASCQPEGVVGAEKQITFQDYNTDTVTTPAPGCLLYDFWNLILTKPSDYKFGYETCDGLFYGMVTDFQVEIDEVIEDNNTGSIYLDGTILWNDIEMICPIQVVGGLDGL